MDGWLKRQMSGINGNAQVFTDLLKGEDILTYGGPTKGNAEKAQRRKDVQCRGFCPCKCYLSTGSCHSVVQFESWR
jgi:hypothetical protein